MFSLSTMIRSLMLSAILIANSHYGLAQDNCLTVESLKQLDAQWENAHLMLNRQFLDDVMADDFKWVHNHGKTVDDKAAVLERIDRYVRQNNRKTKSRDSKDVEVAILGSAAVVSGITVIDKSAPPVTYHFMRTYVKVDGTCYLLANQTMAEPLE